MYRFHITGIVQGVGFRPYIFNACTKQNVLGYVLNVGTGVVIVANDKGAVLDTLKELPPGARIDTCTVSETHETCTDFTIRASEGVGFSEIPSDLFLCEDCLKELRDPDNRRHGYFFLTCTRCGPRFTITKRDPYDRDTTTMRDFTMCPSCRSEYADPKDRRYHAQTIACHDCGPRMLLSHNGVTQVEGTKSDVVQRAAQVLKHGEVLAIKGVGGFHLATTTKAAAVHALKEATGRSDKPFALLCKDIATVQRIAIVTNMEKELLTSVERPIVIVKKAAALGAVSELDSVGVMLPSTALHYLLFEHIDEPLIMTSSNKSGTPITTEKAQQFVPWILDHDRTIENSVDDSLVKVVHMTPFYVRRSRGFVPRSFDAGHKIATPPILAVGAEMNNTFALYREGRITPSQYLGNTYHVETFEHYQKTVRKFMAFTNTRPEIVCTDMHPDFNTTHFGQKLAQELGARHVPVQHHKAHAYSIAFEHKLDDFTAIICDGMGYGEDGTLWGGEIFHNNTRIGHLEQHLQLGGDSATQHPAKMAYSILRKFLAPQEVPKLLGTQFAEKEYVLLNTQWEQKFNASLTSSCGRVLDAAAALLGVCNERTYDGRPAMLLESIATKPFPLSPSIKDGVLLTTPLFQFLVAHRDEDVGRLAATVEQFLAEGLLTIAQGYNRPILWGGGCAYNRRMSSYMLEHGVRTNKQIPAGDGGVSVGQINFVLHHVVDLFT